MLYSRYSNPMDLLKVYINNGRFGDFVDGFIKEETKRKNEEIEKHEDIKLWMAYIQTPTNETYQMWKRRVTGQAPAGANVTAKGRDEDLDDDGIINIINSLFPE